ncbi:caspase domain-containing protein [Vibrio sp. HN007]|uniref:caspase family protein n=1 Tax=Vibrio iocasae TaxID=3098914 RepID=UPI0035D403A2
MRQLLLSTLLFFSVFAHSASQHAIVIGVSEYPNFEPSLSLQGPKNDAIRVWNMLVQQGVKESNIQVLADGVESATLPTKKNIFAAILNLEPQLKSGDFVYLHFSGHGSQQPTDYSAGNSDSADGLDEIFLPRDAGEWNYNIGQVEHSISDNEMNILLTRLRNTGADVWVVFDSCHSGTMTRSLTGQEFRSRSVQAKDLGLADFDQQKVKQASRGTSGLKPVALNEKAGSLISFGSAQSNEEAPEMALPMGDKEVPQGLFTYVLTSIVSSYPNMSYRQLAQGILSVYNSVPWHRTTPLFEGGENLDKPMFHRDSEVSVRYPAEIKREKLIVQAGQLNGFEKGAVISVFDAIDAEEPVASYEIIESGLATSVAELRVGALEKERAFIELDSPAFPNPVRVKWQQAPTAQWHAALEKVLSSNDLLRRTVKWVGADESAELSLYVADDRVYFFTPENMRLPCSLQQREVSCNEINSDEQYISLAIEKSNPDPYATLNNGLSRYIRARNLKRMSAGFSSRSPVASEVLLNDEYRGLEQVITAEDGDELVLSFVNTSKKPVDLTVLFIDSGMGIYQIYPEPGYSGRLFAGEAAEFEGVVSSSSTGEEQFVVIAVPTSRQSPQMSLTHLQQEPMDSASFYEVNQVAKRGNGGLDEVFAQSLGDMPQTRAFKKKAKASEKASISVIRLSTK